jgi:hypothetical protein
MAGQISGQKSKSKGHMAAFGVTRGILQTGHVACTEDDKWLLTVQDDVAQVDDVANFMVDMEH